nr:hypothetical protein FFPRI1PSEUD_52160 [Pseudomonas sp. FFPRI_1]
MVRSRMQADPSIEGRMLVSPQDGGKADIRQIVGRDSVKGRKSARCTVRNGSKDQLETLMSKGL